MLIRCRMLIVPLMAVVAVFVFAACSDDDDGGGGSTDTPAATESPTAAPSPTASATVPPEVPRSHHQVNISGFTFSPAEITVSRDEIATFEIRNDDNGVTHNMHIASNIVAAGEEVTGDYTQGFCDGTADPCSEPAALEGFSDGGLEWVVPNQAGSVQFRCDFHPTSMVGVITIR